MTASHDARAPRATSVEPLLSVRRGAAAIDWYVAAFGSVTVMRIYAHDGAVVTRLTIGDAAF